MHLMLIVLTLILGLVFLHNCGWVHRDLSTGNILVFEGRGILNDLEYAKHWRTEGQAGHTGRVVCLFLR